MVSRKPSSAKREICYGIFHIDNDGCFERHKLMERLIDNIDDLWVNLEVQTHHFQNLEEAEKCATRRNILFNHISQDRKPGVTGFLKGEIGIWLGTIDAISKFLISDFKYLILFEDDVISSKEGVQLVNLYLSNRNLNFDIFSFFVPENDLVRYGRKRHFLTFIRKNFLYDDPRLTTRLYQDWSCLSYAISRRGAKKILKSIENGISSPLDWHLYRGRFRGLNFKPMGPKPFYLSKLASTIQMDRP